MSMERFEFQPDNFFETGLLTGKFADFTIF